MKRAQQPDIGLFSTPAGIRAVESPVRVRILSVLATKELPFDEIVRLSRRAKSTVSVHLKGLEEDGIIASRPDPKDSRKKIFFIRSPSVGNLSEKLVFPDDSLNTPGADPFAFYRYMFRTIRVSLLTEGINIDPVLNEAGYRVGLAFSSSLSDNDLRKVLKKTQAFWKKNNLGTLEIESVSPLCVRAYDCFECGSLPKLGRPACAFDSGLLRAIFSQHFGTDQQVDETACYAAGDDHCRFVIAPR
ncbi:MAG: V4R domain-containing protein [Methanoregula sp.]